MCTTRSRYLCSKCCKFSPHCLQLALPHVRSDIKFTLQHLPALAALEGLWDLKAIYSRSQSSAEKLATAARLYASSTSHLSVYYDSEDLSSLTSLDALLSRKDITTVILALPIVFQPTIIEKAWKAGKNVISEKPIAKDLKEAKRLIKLYEECYEGKGIEWFVAEQFPVSPFEK